MKSTVEHISILILTLLVAGPAAAGLGVETSASVRLDALAPEVGIVAAPEGQVLQGGETTYFAWWASDANPAPHDSSRVASVFVRDVVVDTLRYSAALDHAWHWTVVGHSAPGCSLVVSVRDEFGNLARAHSGTFRIWGSDTLVSDLPAPVVLSPPAPNPFNPRTMITFKMAVDGPATLAVYDLLGRRVRRILESDLRAGTHVRPWDGRGDDGRRLAGGPYLVRLDAAGEPPLIRKVVLLP